MRSEVSALGHDPDFLIFVVIDSESDYLPPREVRSQCTPAWLHRCNFDERDLEARYGQEVRAACARLVSRFS
jgi:hypothetical protein